MKLPSFTAEASLSPTTTRYWLASTTVNASSQGLIVPARSRIWTRFCAIGANRCTYDCDPFDGGCRDGCNDFFFSSLDADPTL